MTLLGTLSAQTQEPIIRVKQLGTWSTPAMWWKGSVTQDLDDFLAQDVSKPAEDNNNFDIWRDKVLEMEVTLDDNGADITTFRLDIAFDNDLITIKYGFARAGLDDGQILNHIKYPVFFALKQIGILIPFFFLVWLLIKKIPKKLNFKDDKLIFLLFINIIESFLIISIEYFLIIFFPSLLCIAANLNLSFKSFLIINWIELKHKLQTPSNKIIILSFIELIKFYTELLYNNFGWEKELFQVQDIQSPYW